MHMPALFRALKFTIQLVSFLLAILFNSTLIVLILTKSPKKMGTYKYLLIYFCSFSIVYAILDIIVEPYIHSFGSAFFMIMSLKTWNMSPFVGYLFTSLLCGCFAISVTTIAIQFIFRFLAMERKGRLSYFQGKFLVVWFVVPLISATIWITQDWLFLMPNPKMSDYIREVVKLNYGLEIEEITYCGSFFYPPDENGVPRMDYFQLAAYFGFCTTMGVPFWTLVIFGWKSYQLVKELPSQGDSGYTKCLQMQLYKALVAQAFIPIVFLFFPIGLLFTAPLLGVNIEPISFLVTFFYSMYPAVDPLPIMLIVTDYRTAVTDALRTVFRLPKNQVSALADGQVTSLS